MENELCLWLADGLGVPVAWLRLADAPEAVAVTHVEVVDSGSFTDVLGHRVRRARVEATLAGYGMPPRFQSPAWWLENFGTPEVVVWRKCRLAADKKHPDDRDMWTGEVEVMCHWTE